MGKGGANPYPLWWASSDNEVVKDKPQAKQPDKPKKERKQYNTDNIYESKRDKEKEYWDKYYAQKSWSQRRKEFEKQFKEDFLKGKYFHEPDSEANETNRTFHHENNDIHPVFKIKKSSSEEDFKQAYRKLILQNHPDKGGDSKVFINIQEAWERIKVHFAS